VFCLSARQRISVSAYDRISLKRKPVGQGADGSGKNKKKNSLKLKKAGRFAFLRNAFLRCYK
jgi:hypothetical protein